MTDESWRDRNVAQRNFHLLNSEFMADCTFLVGITEKKTFQCHKFVLSQGSPVFYAMFNGDLKENGDVKVEDIEPQHFKKMLEYIYSDNTELKNAETALSVCYAANKYMINTLILKCIDFIKKNLNPDVVCRALEFARLIDNADLEAGSLQYLQLHTSKVLNSGSFPNVERATLLTIINNDDFVSNTSAVEVFSACIRWATAQGGTEGSLRDVLGLEVLRIIRFLSMTAHEFATVVAPSKLLSANEESEILCRLITGTGNIPQGFNISTETRATFGPRETIEIQAHHRYALRGIALKEYPFHLSFNTNVFIFGLQLHGLHLEENSVIKDNLIVKLLHDSKLLASANFDGMIYANAYVEVNFNEPILLKANTNYTLQTIYRNTNMRCLVTQMLESVYNTTTAVKMTVDCHYTTISKIYIAEKIPK